MRLQRSQIFVIGWEGLRREMGSRRPEAEDKLTEIDKRLNEIHVAQIAILEDSVRRSQEIENMAKRLDAVEQAIIKRRRRR